MQDDTNLKALNVRKYWLALHENFRYFIDQTDNICCCLQALYGKLFSWIVHRINALLRTDRGRLTVYVHMH